MISKWLFGLYNYPDVMLAILFRVSILVAIIAVIWYVIDMWKNDELIMLNGFLVLLIAFVATFTAGIFLPALIGALFWAMFL
jgi:hypothetical protein